jgi:predicted dehydrogenase
MSKKIGFGIVGAGLIAPFHLNSISDAEGGYAVGVCDIDRQKADAVADKFGIKAYTDIDKMLANDDIDVVCVATPNHLHHDIVIKAARAGKHVLTEKPPAMTLEETDQMIKECENAGVRFGCFVQCRIRKAIQAIKKAIDSGRFGRLLHADTYMKWYRPQDYYTSDSWRGQKKSGSGVTVAQGFHYIDLLQYLAGPAGKVEAKMSNIAHPGVDLEDDVISYIDYKNGAKGVIQLSTAIWPGTDIRIEINGTKGTAIMTGERMDTWEFEDNRPEDQQIRNYGSSSQATGAGGAADFGYKDHQVVVEDMIDAVNNNREVLIPVSSVRPSLEMVLAMYQSDYKGKPVELPVQDDENVW